MSPWAIGSRGRQHIQDDRVRTAYRLLHECLLNSTPHAGSLEKARNWWFKTSADAHRRARVVQHAATVRKACFQLARSNAASMSSAHWSVLVDVLAAPGDDICQPQLHQRCSTSSAIVPADRPASCAASSTGSAPGDAAAEKPASWNGCQVSHKDVVVQQARATCDMDRMIAEALAQFDDELEDIESDDGAELYLEPSFRDLGGASMLGTGRPAKRAAIRVLDGQVTRDEAFEYVRDVRAQSNRRKTVSKQTGGAKTRGHQFPRRSNRLATITRTGSKC